MTVSKGENLRVPTGVGLRGVSGNAFGTVVGESLQVLLVGFHTAINALELPCELENVRQ